MFLEIDSISQIVTSDTDVTVAALERELNQTGYTLNYHPLPHKDVLLVDAINGRWPNLYYETFGGIEDLCVQLKLARADGSLWQNRLTPRSATGPNFKKLAIGSQENFGVPVQAVLKIFRQPEVECLAFVTFTKKRYRDFFIQALKRQRISLSLLVEIISVSQKRELKVEKETVVLGYIFWGNKTQTQALQSYLQDLVKLKHGDYVELPKGQNAETWRKRLHQIAINDWQKEQRQATKEIHKSQLKLEERLKRI